jgi:hypothetical protein
MKLKMNTVTYILIINHQLIKIILLVATIVTHMRYYSCNQ